MLYPLRHSPLQMDLFPRSYSRCLYSQTNTTKVPSALSTPAVDKTWWSGLFNALLLWPHRRRSLVGKQEPHHGCRPALSVDQTWSGLFGSFPEDRAHKVPLKHSESWEHSCTVWDWLCSLWLKLPWTLLVPNYCTSVIPILGLSGKRFITVPFLQVTLHNT